MNELAGLHQQISEPDEYKQYLLSALLTKSATDAGKKLNINESRAVVAEFFVSRQADRKTQAGNRRSATMSRKMRDIRAQEKATFTGNPPAHDADAERQINQPGPAHMKHIIIFCLLLSLGGCATVKDVKKGVIPPSCPLCQHSL
ncbi:TPA: hypothetical protein O7139_005324 [Salmonella enterica]|nr:hypothetical protein [Salmonella enterica]HDC2563205.1 hypothetical protein [Salmonella enterica]